MADIDSELHERFERYADSTNGQLPLEILGELQSMLRLYHVSPEDLYFKWEAYTMKMGGDELKLDLKASRDFKKHIHETLERESRAKQPSVRTADRRAAPTPRAGADDVFGMLVPNTPRPRPSAVNGSTIKRKSNFDTPAAKAHKNHEASSPGGALPPAGSGPVFNFAERQNAGEISEQLNGDIEIPEPPEEPPAESRIKLKANTDMSKFSYRNMAMKLSEASEVLDDRIDEFRQIVQEHHKLEDEAFGNPNIISASEIVAVGRIACDSSEGKLNAASLVLESSRRFGSGRRIPLRVETLQSYNFFPGQIVAVRGTNASGEYFAVREILEIPLLPGNATTPEELDTYNSRYLDTPESDPSNVRPLTILVASGPYTTDQSLDYSPLQALLDTAASSCADALVLIGPFLDAEHPAIRTGDFEVPPHLTNPDTATLSDLFKHHISCALQSFCARLPTCSVVLVPSLRDAHHHTVAFPQDKFPKKELGLPRQVQCVTNPMTLSMNEFAVGMSSLDILDMLRREECVGGKAKMINLYERAARNVIEQRSFLPLFPVTSREKLGNVAPVEEKIWKGEGADESAEADRSPFLPLGTMVDIPYLKLADMLNWRPDVLITPSVLGPCIKVVESVLVINPGTLSKRRAAGTYARLIVQPLELEEGEREKGEAVGHRMWKRTRVDIVKV